LYANPQDNNKVNNSTLNQKVAQRNFSPPSANIYEPKKNLLNGHKLMQTSKTTQNSWQGRKGSNFVYLSSSIERTVSKSKPQGKSGYQNGLASPSSSFLEVLKRSKQEPKEAHKSQTKNF
jgi:hypothetical protein